MWGLGGGYGSVGRSRQKLSVDVRAPVGEITNYLLLVVEVGGGRWKWRVGQGGNLGGGIDSKVLLPHYCVSI